MTQADLARETHFTPVTVHRWATGKAPLRGGTAEAVAAVLRAHGVAVGLAPDCRVFLASPMAALDPDGYEQARADAEAVFAALVRVAGPVYWPAGGIGSAAGFEAPDLATARNLSALHACEAFVYLQVGPLDRPTSCHIELGWALALGKPVTVLAPSEEQLPYMLRRYEIVAGHDGGWYRFHPVGDVLRLLDIHGAELLGLSAAVTA